MEIVRFSIAETINQMIAGAVTLVTVLVGAKLAIRGGLAQVRHERLLDRRLAMLEQLSSKLDDYVTSLQVLVQIESDTTATAAARPQLADNALLHATEAGRAVQEPLRLARIHGDAKLIALGDRNFRAQLDTYMLSWSRRDDLEARSKQLNLLSRNIGVLDTLASEVRNDLRSELGLPPLLGLPVKATALRSSGLPATTDG